jgi:transcriptional regulator with XRE-family HTH domain
MKVPIKVLRKQKGLTQKQLGLLFKKKKAPETICRWERCQAAPEGESLQELAAILGVSADTILIKTKHQL